MNNDSLVEVYRAGSSVQARLMASALEDEGIRAFVYDELESSANIPPGWTTAPRIMVPQADSARARTLLERLEKSEGASED